MKILTIMLCLIAQTAFAGWSGPSTYEECIDNYIPKTKIKVSAVVIQRICSEQFKSKITDPKRLQYYECARARLIEVMNEASARIMNRRCKEDAGLMIKE